MENKEIHYHYTSPLAGIDISKLNPETANRLIDVEMKKIDVELKKIDVASDLMKISISSIPSIIQALAVLKAAGREQRRNDIPEEKEAVPDNGKGKHADA